MPWLSVTLTVGAGSVEALSDALLDAGAMSVEVVDARAGTAREQALFGEPGRPEPVPWALSRVSALFEQHEDITARATAALRAAGLDADDVTRQIMVLYANVSLPDGFAQLTETQALDLLGSSSVDRQG